MTILFKRKSILFIAAAWGIFLGGASFAPAAGEPIRFAYQDRIADAASVIAVRKAFFADEGPTVKPLRFSSGPAAGEALYSGAADIGSMGDAAAVIALARNVGLVILGSHGGGEGRHRIVLRPGLAVDGPAGLKGKTLAVKKGTSTHAGLLAYLEAHGLSASSLRIFDLRPVDMPQALSAGSVDAICASEPTPSLAEKRGGTAFADLSGLGNAYPILLMARQRFVDSHPEAVIRFLRAMDRAARFAANRPEETAEVLSQATGLDQDMCLKAMRRHAYRLHLDAAMVESLTKTGRSLADHGRIPTVPDFSRFMRPDLLQKALRR